MPEQALYCTGIADNRRGLRCQGPESAARSETLSGGCGVVDREHSGTVACVRTLRAITTEAELRELVGAPTSIVRAKLADQLNDLTRQFVERSPFVCVATASPDGGMDVS